MSVNYWRFEEYLDGYVITGFTGDASVTSVEVPATHSDKTVYGIRGSSSVEGTYLSVFGNQFEENIESVTIASGVTFVGTGAFANCDNLASLVLPNTLQYIDNGAFYNCVSLPSVNIPNTVTTIGDFAFGNCIGLVSISLPTVPITISRYAFTGCTGLSNYSSLELSRYGISPLTDVNPPKLVGTDSLAVFLSKLREIFLLEKGDEYNMSLPDSVTYDQNGGITFNGMKLRDVNDLTKVGDVNLVLPITAGSNISLTVSNGKIVISSSAQVTVDSALSTTSENPVQNKVVKGALDNKADLNNSSQTITADELNANTINVPGVQISTDTQEARSWISSWYDLEFVTQPNGCIRAFNVDTERLKNGTNSDYGLAVPDTRGLTADKTIATTDQISPTDSALSNTSTNPVQNKVITNALPNPNLLINGDFRVNQRGKTSYTSDGYTIDRWYSSYFTVNKYSDSIKITSTGNYGSRFFQVLPYDVNHFYGKKITISADIRSIETAGGHVELVIRNCSSLTGTVNNEWTSDMITTPGVKSFTVEIPSYMSGNKLVAGIAGYNLGNIITLKYIKVEFGDVATPFIPRPMCEELSLCQAYYLKIGDNNYTCYGLGTAFGSTRVEVVIDYPRTMQKKVPTLTVSGSIRLNQNNLSVAGTSANTLTIEMDESACTTKSATLKCTLTNSLSNVNQALILQSNNDQTAYLAFDAEDY